MREKHNVPASIIIDTYIIKLSYPTLDPFPIIAPPIGMAAMIKNACKQHAIAYLLPKSFVLEICPIQMGVIDKTDPLKNLQRHI